MGVDHAEDGPLEIAGYTIYSARRKHSNLVLEQNTQRTRTGASNVSVGQLLNVLHVARNVDDSHHSW